MDEAGKVGNMQRHLDAQTWQLDSTKRALKTKVAVVNEKAHECGRLELVLKPAHTAVSKGERVMRDFVDRVYTEYSLLLGT